MGSRNLIRYFIKAQEASMSSLENDLRQFHIGAIGIRSDGAIVTSRNLSSESRCPPAHAEARLIKKLDKNSIVFVARVTKGGAIGLAKPCPTCQIALKNKGVKRAYYTIDKDNFGVIDFE